MAVPTGLVGLDEVLGGGLYPGALIGVGGGSGQNKTSLLTSIARGASRAGAIVIYATAELPRAEIAARVLAAECFDRSRTSPDLQWSPSFSEIRSGRAWSGGSGIDVVDLGVRRLLEDAVAGDIGEFEILDLLDGGSVDEIKKASKAARARDPGRPVVVLVDPVQQVAPATDKDGFVPEEVYERIGRVAGDLKRVADQVGAAVVFASDGTKGSAFGSTSLGDGFRGSYELVQRATVSLVLVSAENENVVEERLRTEGLPWLSKEKFGSVEIPAWWVQQADRLGSHVLGVAVFKNRYGRSGVVLPVRVVPGACFFFDTRVSS